MYERHVTNESPALAQRTVLVVDDELPNLALFSAHLEHEGL